MGIGAHIKHGMQPLVDLVYPPRCPSCGVAVAQQGGLCPDCWGQIEFPNGGDGNSPVIAATVYNEISRKLVLTFKHGGKITLAALLGQIMASRMPPALSNGSALLVPVPLHRTRLWERGFNQAALLAKELSRRGHGQLLVDGLVRKKLTPSLGGLGKEERRAALEGAIAVRSVNAKRINGRAVILVDDVLTSGATSDACVAALRNAGALSVQIACFARVTEG